MKICIQHMSNLCDGDTQDTHILDINNDTTSQANLAYNLIYLDLLRPITLIGHNGAKYARFFTNNHHTVNGSFI